MSGERSPATEQAAELDRLVSGLGYEPDTVDEPAVDAVAAPPTETDQEDAAALAAVELPVGAGAAMGGSPLAEAPPLGDDGLEPPPVLSEPAPPDSAPSESPPAESTSSESVPAGEPELEPGSFDVDVDIEPEESPPVVPGPSLWGRAESSPPPPGATSVALPGQDWSEVTAAPVLAEPTPMTSAVPAATAPVAATARGRSRRVIRSRKVRRVIRHIDPWSVLTFSVIFHLCLFGALLLSGSLVWSAAVASGTIDNIESFIRDLGDYETWEIQGDAVLRAGVIIAGMLTLASSILVVLLAVVFNLISDLIGGIRVTVVEEELHRVPVARRK